MVKITCSSVWIKISQLINKHKKIFLKLLLSNNMPTLSKVFEQIVLNQMIAYIEERAFLGATMSGFRKGHSTTTVLLSIRDTLIRASKKGEVTLMVYANYNKAFDTVQYRTVLTKMHGLGFSKSFRHWVINYITNRQQLVQVNVRKSSLLTVEFGVPQSSVLGPMFFNLYVADLQEKLQLHSYQYADDTSLYSHSKVCDLDSALKEVNDAIVRLVDYSQCYNLALNSSKTDWMLFSTVVIDCQN